MTESAEAPENTEPAQRPKRRTKQYWDKMVLKAMLINGDYMINEIIGDGFHHPLAYNKSRKPAYDWEDEFAALQKALGIYPMSNYDVHQFYAAFQRLHEATIQE